MSEIVAKIADHEAKPKGKVKMLVIEIDNAVDGKVAGQDSEEGKGWRVYNAVAKSRTQLRVDWKHMMDAMEDVMQVADNPVVGEDALTVEDEAVDEVLGESE